MVPKASSRTGCQRDSENAALDEEAYARCRHRRLRKRAVEQKSAYDASAQRLEDLVRAQNPAVGAQPPVGFEHLVQQLYVSAMIQMGAGAQEGQRPRVDILGARQTIDMLGVLAEKTKGNLTESEHRTLADGALRSAHGLPRIDQHDLRCRACSLRRHRAGQTLELRKTMEGLLTFLGTGTSMGVPTLGCDCAVCTSADPHDRRLRPSVLLRWHEAGRERVVVIDTGPDFREQALRNGLTRVDAVLLHPRPRRPHPGPGRPAPAEFYRCSRGRPDSAVCLRRNG